MFRFFSSADLVWKDFPHTVRARGKLSRGERPVLAARMGTWMEEAGSRHGQGQSPLEPSVGGFLAGPRLGRSCADPGRRCASRAAGHQESRPGGERLLQEHGTKLFASSQEAECTYTAGFTYGAFMRGLGIKIQIATDHLRTYCQAEFTAA